MVVTLLLVVCRPADAGDHKLFKHRSHPPLWQAPLLPPPLYMPPPPLWGPMLPHEPAAFGWPGDCDCLHAPVGPCDEFPIESGPASGHSPSPTPIPTPSDAPSVLETPSIPIPSMEPRSPTPRAEPTPMTDDPRWQTVPPRSPMPAESRPANDPVPMPRDLQSRRPVQSSQSVRPVPGAARAWYFSADTAIR